MQRPKLVAIPSKEQAIIHNLPTPLTSLIGREQEVTTACTLLRRPDVRLVTLTGTGGIGKTRLALQVAAELLDEFADGVSFLSLAPIIDPDLIIPTIAQTFDLKETGVRSLPDLLKAYLRDKYLLLVLDNFEQILPAAPQLTDLLASCPHLSILVTSRATLHVQGEHEFSVPPLALPDLTQLPEPEVLTQYAAVTLFLQRAHAAKPTFQLTPSNVRIIAEICIRLDGLPLAIELAATRVKLLSSPALLARLEHRLQVLTSGTQDAPTRQQTLRNTIAWSYDLLSAAEQRLFRRLSVFVGGCTLEAVEALYTALSDETMQVMDGVTSLLDKSLLQPMEQGGDEPRLMMLETIREFGLEVLASSGELELTLQAQSSYYLALAEEAPSKLFAVKEEVWYKRLEQEHDNLRATLNWLLERNEAQMALRLGGALGTFWSKRRHFNEGQAFLERALAASEGVVTSARAKALWAAGWLAWVIFISQGDIATVRSLIAEGQAVFQELGVRAHLRLMLDLSAEVAFHEGDVDTARALTEESLALSRAMKEGYTIEALSVLARVSAFQGNHATARALYEEILAKAREFSDQLNIAFALEGLASVVVLQGEPTWAARLWGTAAALREALGAPLPPVYHSGYERSIIAARTQLGEKTFAIAWAEGHAMTLDEVLAAQRAALVPMPDPTRQSSPSPAKLAATYPDDLTAREVEVLLLLAQGLTDAQIAEQSQTRLPQGDRKGSPLLDANRWARSCRVGARLALALGCGGGLSVSQGAVHEHFKDLLSMLDRLAIGTSMCCWHDNMICPFWQRHQIRLIFF